MDFLTILTYVLAVVETGALVFALLFATKAIQEKKDEIARKAHYRRAAIYLVVYVVLNCIRRFYFQA